MNMIKALFPLCNRQAKTFLSVTAPVAKDRVGNDMTSSGLSVYAGQNAYVCCATGARLRGTSTKT